MRELVESIPIYIVKKEDLGLFGSFVKNILENN